jgi:hypothetical protein
MTESAARRIVVTLSWVVPVSLSAPPVTVKTKSSVSALLPLARRTTIESPMTPRWARVTFWVPLRTMASAAERYPMEGPTIPTTVGVIPVVATSGVSSSSV